MAGADGLQTDAVEFGVPAVLILAAFWVVAHLNEGAFFEALAHLEPVFSKQAESGFLWVFVAIFDDETGFHPMSALTVAFLFRKELYDSTVDCLHKFEN